MSLLFQQFMADKEYQSLKKKLLNVYQRYHSQLTGVKLADPSLKLSYQEAIDSFSKKRGGKLWFPYVSSGLGNGCLVQLNDGSVKYDFISGIGVHFSHGDPLLISQLIDAAFEDSVMQGNLQQNGASSELVSLFCEQSGMDHSFLTTSGAMAAENGLKLLFHRKPGATRLMAFEKCFMGRTLALAQITDNAAYRKGLPSTMKVDYVPFYDHRDHRGSIDRSLTVIKRYLARYPDAYAGICMEMIQGEGGYYAGHEDFFKAIIKVMKENQVGVLVDEIQTFGRTQNMFAYHTFNLQGLVDVVLVGKLSQVCATLFRTDFKPMPGLISQTFTSSSAAIAASLYVLKTLTNNHYFGEKGKIVALRKHFVSQLEKLSALFPTRIQGPFGCGLMIAFTPFEGSKETSTKIVHALYAKGVLSFLTGRDPVRIRFLMPVGGVTKQDIDHVVAIIADVLEGYAL